MGSIAPSKRAGRSMLRPYKTGADGRRVAKDVHRA
jgi:hypothetical protein